MIAKVESLGLKPHVLVGVERTVIAAIGAERDGLKESLEAGTGVPVDQLYDAYFASFGVAAPTAVEPAPILPSDVDKPPQPSAVPAEPRESMPTASAEPEPASPADDGAGWIPVAVVAGVALAAMAAVVAGRRRLRARP